MHLDDDHHKPHQPHQPQHTSVVSAISSGITKTVGSLFKRMLGRSESEAPPSHSSDDEPRAHQRQRNGPSNLMSRSKSFSKGPPPVVAERSGPSMSRSRASMEVKQGSKALANGVFVQMGVLSSDHGPMTPKYVR